MPKSRLLAVGDIHGCDTALSMLLDAVQLRAGDVLVFLGDYIDRGPGSRQVIEKLLSLESVCSPVFLRGNHEVMILDGASDFLLANNWQSYGGLETLHSYRAAYKDDW